MSETPLLALPLIAPDQAQKHVTHNEALARLDGLVHLVLVSRSTGVPPAEPEIGAAWLCAAGASGEWAGRDGSVAIFTQGGWRFHTPRSGWRAWIEDEGALAVLDGAAWRIVAGDGAARLGINTNSDTLNRLSVRSEAVLFTAAGAPGSGDMRMKLNREGEADTVSLLFQTGFSGRGEIGFAGGEDLSIKVSADGAEWREAIRVDRASGAVALPSGVAMLRGLLLDETWAAIAAMPVPPRRQRTFLLDDTIAALVEAGHWAKLDFLYLLAAHDEDAAGVNLRSPRSDRLVASGAPAFTAHRGFTGDGVAAMLATGFVAAGASGLLSLDDAHIGAWVLGGAAADGGVIGTPDATSARLSLTPNALSGNATAEVNDASALTAPAAGAAAGHFVAARRAGAGRALYRDGTSVAADAAAATALPDAPVVLLASQAGFSPAELAAAHAGAGLDAAEAASLTAILSTYLGAVGAL